MKVLIANPGSTSYKCKLYETAGMKVLYQATVERIGESEGIFTFNFSDEESITDNLEIKN